MKTKLSNFLMSIIAMFLFAGCEDDCCEKDFYYFEGKVVATANSVFIPHNDGSIFAYTTVVRYIDCDCKSHVAHSAASYSRGDTLYVNDAIVMGTY